MASLDPELVLEGAVPEPVAEGAAPEPVVVVPFGALPLAAWRKASKVLPEVGALMAKTMPFWQWPVCWHENQRGSVSFTRTLNIGKSSVREPSTDWLWGKRA